MVVIKSRPKRFHSWHLSLGGRQIFHFQLIVCGRNVDRCEFKVDDDEKFHNWCVSVAGWRHILGSLLSISRNWKNLETAHQHIWSCQFTPNLNTFLSNSLIMAGWGHGHRHCRRPFYCYYSFVYPFIRNIGLDLVVRAWNGTTSVWLMKNHDQIDLCVLYCLLNAQIYINIVLSFAFFHSCSLPRVCACRSHVCLCVRVFVCAEHVQIAYLNFSCFVRYFPSHIYFVGQNYAAKNLSARSFHTLPHTHTDMRVCVVFVLCFIPLGHAAMFLHSSQRRIRVLFLSISVWCGQYNVIEYKHRAHRRT